MTKYPVERIVTAFAAYVAANLPALLTQANVGMAVAAPAFARIGKTVHINPQYLPAVAVNLDGGTSEASGSNSVAVDLRINVIAATTGKDEDQISTYLERYIDAISDLASENAQVGAEGFEIEVQEFDKGVEPDGKRGFSVVQFRVWGEALF
ncbi:MAG: hypothetical protein A2001_01435 [Treponema sp. GWC1_61_84]|nr:MAG: hypothetical protein A2001_01435 [Treponema sp. GWC1_61_84]